jgi:hypothetical protein
MTLIPEKLNFIFFTLRYDVNIESVELLFKVGLPFQMSG